jgi:hypothetical protein
VARIFDAKRKSKVSSDLRFRTLFRNWKDRFSLKGLDTCSICRCNEGLLLTNIKIIVTLKARFGGVRSDNETTMFHDMVEEDLPFA